MKRRKLITVDPVSLTETEFILEDGQEIMLEAVLYRKYGNRFQVVNRRILVPLSQFLPESKKKG